MVVTHLKSFCKPARGGVTKLPNPQPMKNIEDTSRKMLMTTVMMMSCCHGAMMTKTVAASTILPRIKNMQDSWMFFSSKCENDLLDKSKYKKVFSTVNGKTI